MFVILFTFSSFCFFKCLCARTKEISRFDLLTEEVATFLCLTSKQEKGYNLPVHTFLLIRTHHQSEDGLYIVP